MNGFHKAGRPVWRIFFINGGILIPEETIMKKTEQKEPTPTIPDGVWESSRPVPDPDPADKTSPAEDLQKNEYPPKNGRVEEGR